LDGWDTAELLNPLRKAGVWIETVAKGRIPYDKIGRLLLMLEGEGGNEQLADTARNVLTKHIECARDQQRPPLPQAPSATAGRSSRGSSAAAAAGWSPSFGWSPTRRRRRWSAASSAGSPRGTP